MFFDIPFWITNVFSLLIKIKACVNDIVQKKLSIVSIFYRVLFAQSCCTWDHAVMVDLIGLNLCCVFTDNF